MDRLFNRIGRKQIIWLGLALLVVLGGVWGYNFFKVRLEPVSITSTTPAMDALEVSLAPTIVITSDKPFNILPGSLSLSPEMGPIILESGQQQSQIHFNQALAVDTPYTLTFQFTNRYGWMKKTQSLTFTTRNKNTIISIKPADSSVINLDDNLTLVFQYQIRLSDLDIALSPTIKPTLALSNDTLSISPPLLWVPNTDYTLSIKPSSSATTLEQFDPFTFHFKTTNDATQSGNYNKIKTYQQSYQNTDDPATQAQIKGDALFYQQTKQDIASTPELKILNQLLTPLITPDFTINYWVSGGFYTIGYYTEAGKQKALDWFAAQGYTPSKINYIPMTPRQ